MRPVRSWTCPACGCEQPAGKDTCERCSVVVAKAHLLAQREARLHDAKLLEGADTSIHIPVDKLRRKLLMMAWAAFALTVVWYAVAPPRSRPPLPGAYEDPSGRFSFHAPEGWERSPEQPSVSGDFLRLLRYCSGEGGWVVRVAQTPREFPRPLDQAAQASLAAWAQGTLPEGLTEFQVMDVERGKRDGLDSIGLWGYGQRVHQRREIATLLDDSYSSNLLQPGFERMPYGMAGYPQQGAGGHALMYYQRDTSTVERFLFYLEAVRGSETTYLFGLLVNDGDPTPREALARKLFMSVRVLDRPYSLPHVQRLLFEHFRKEFILFVVGALFALTKWLLS